MFLSFHKNNVCLKNKNLSLFEKNLVENTNDLNTKIFNISTRLTTLESKFSNNQPVDSQSGSYTIGIIAPDGGHSVSKVISFNTAFGSTPTVTARISSFNLAP